MAENFSTEKVGFNRRLQTTGQRPKSQLAWHIIRDYFSDMPISVHLYKMLDSVDPILRDVLIAILEEIERQQKERVTKDEFRELKQVVGELAQAQKRTEEEVKKLAKGMRETRQMVGGLSDSVGYGLEDRAIASLPVLLKERYGIEADDGFVRKFMEVNGREVELNMFGTGRKGEQKWYVVGEGKAKLSKKDVDRFLKLLDRLRLYRIVGDNVLPVMVTYSTRPAVQGYAEEKGINIIWSYELEQSG